MPFDPASIGPEAKAKDIEIGEDFGSDDVLRQLDVSILGADKYATSLVLYGWPATQTQKMREVRALLGTALIQRDSAKAAKKTTNAALLDAVRAGKNARGAARTALTTARNELFEQGQLDLVNQIDGVLAVTAGSGAHAKLLAQQLGNLGPLLSQADVAAILGDAAAPVQNLVSTAATALDVAIKSKDRPLGTPPETEYINLLDGVAVVLVRTLRKAGRAAAKALGQPDIADAFQLSELYRTPPHRAADEPPPNPPST
jgi:hypothetical protein